MKQLKIAVDIHKKGRPESLGHSMHKQSSLGKIQLGNPDSAPGEFDELLREIENEPMPERLLELALKLQARLVEQRKRDGEKDSAES